MAIPGAENKWRPSAQPVQDIDGTSSSVQGTLRMSKEGVQEPEDREKSFKMPAFRSGTATATLNLQQLSLKALDLHETEPV